MTQLQELATREHAPPFRRIEVTQAGGVIGAVVSGIRVGGGADADEVAELRSAFVGPDTGYQRAAGSPAAGLRGTTVWANTVEGYRRLHPALQALTGGLRAMHSISTAARPSRPA